MAEKNNIIPDQEIEIDDYLPDSAFAYIDDEKSGKGRPPGCPTFIQKDAVLPFYLKHAAVRGRVVRLDVLGEKLLERHHYPEPVSALCGQTAALTAALATALKFDGLFTLQIQSTGRVNLVASDCTSDGELRVMAQHDPKASYLQGTKPMELFGQGRMVVTVQSKDHPHPYQAIVPLEGDELSHMAEAYFKGSEQHACRVFLFSKKHDGKWNAGALVLERLPSASKDASVEEIDELWGTACTFATTLKNDEMLDPKLSLEQIVHRLFSTLEAKVTDTKPLSYGCRCTREKFEQMFANFSHDDIDHMARDNRVTVDCAYCEVRFAFNPDKLKKSPKP